MGRKFIFSTNRPTEICEIITEIVQIVGSDPKSGEIRVIQSKSLTANPRTKGRGEAREEEQQ